jgi:UDP-N-acetylmuramoylalanine--D-glutamate ligase
MVYHEETIKMKKELYLPYFQGKKVTVMGLGLLGRGIGDTQFLAENGAELIVTDKKTKEDLMISLQALEKYIGITYRLGEHLLSDFENRDFILKAAGVPLESEYIRHAKEKNIPVYMSAALVAHIAKENLKGVKIVGVTGTRGKSTVTNLVHHILVEAGVRAHLGGNVRGLANLPLLKEIEEEDTLVLELDSWQLQGFNDLKLSPDVAIFTSFLDDHLNYYGNDRELYFSDKASIYRHQKEGDVLIASAQAREEIYKRDGGRVVVAPDVAAYDSQLIGIHNEVLVSLAYEACARLGVPEDKILSGIASFKPVEGRLEYVGDYRGALVYNDNNATTPDATVMGVEAIIRKYGRNPILICGGSDKNLNLDALTQAIKTKTKDYVLLSGTGTEHLGFDGSHVCETLEECMQKAFSLAEKGDVILFSPGFASFSKYFKNEYERNDAFVTLLGQFK